MPWRDIGVYIHGDVVAHYVKNFISYWNFDSL